MADKIPQLNMKTKVAIFIMALVYLLGDAWLYTSFSLADALVLDVGWTFAFIIGGAIAYSALNDNDSKDDLPKVS